MNQQASEKIRRAIHEPIITEPCTTEETAAWRNNKHESSVEHEYDIKNPLTGKMVHISGIPEVDIDWSVFTDEKETEYDHNIQIYKDFERRFYRIKSPYCIFDKTKNIPLAPTHVRDFYSAKKNKKDFQENLKPDIYDDWYRKTENIADSFDFRPDKPPHKCFLEHDDKTGLNNRVFNLFSGFISPNPLGKCDLFLNFVHDVIADNSETNYTWILNWMARIIQKPCDRIHSYALSLQSVPGCGKTFFNDSLGHLLGNCYLKVDDMENIMGFNSLICGKVLLYCEEAIFTASQKESNRLKNIINGDALNINQKFVAQYTIKNYLTVSSGTNGDVSAPVELGDRRWVCLKLSQSHKEDHDYFRSIQDQLDDGGYGALMYYLQNYKLDFNILDDRPITTLHRENQKAWMYKNKPVYTFLKKLLDEFHGGSKNLLSELSVDKDTGKCTGWIESSVFNTQYAEFLSKNHEHRGVDARSVVTMLKEILGREDITGRVYFKNKQERAYHIGSIAELDAALYTGEEEIHDDEIPF
jgi:hypothetical protein